MPVSKEKLNNLVKHLEYNKSKLANSSVPERHAGKEVAYREYLQREVTRTSKKIEDLTLEVK